VSTEHTRGGVIDPLDVRHRLADDLGAEWHVLNREEPARALVDFAREHQVTQIVLGSSRRSRWEELTKGSVVQRVLRFAADCDVDVHVIARRDDESIEGPEQSE
jgi:two-component system sensor histidine kinase KdpD